MAKKKILLGVIVLVLIVSGYFGYKAFNLFYYDFDIFNNSEIKLKDLKVKDGITITTNVLDENSYLIFNNMRIRNDFKEFQLMEEYTANNSVKYVLRDENNQTVASFWMGTENSKYVDMFTSDVSFFNLDDSKFQKIDRTNLLKKKNITNDIELFKYLAENNNFKNNIFTSVSDMKEKYALQFLASIILPSSDITLINGNYTGYMFNIQNKAKVVNILKDDKIYIFTFLGFDYFNDEYVRELLNTIVID